MSGSTAWERHASFPQHDPVLDLQPRPPQWVDDVLGPHPSQIDVGPQTRALVSGPLALLTAKIPLAANMPAPTLRAEVTRAYLRLESALAALEREPVRFWNYIPAIGETMGPGLDRYMVFNSGRHDAFAPGRLRAAEPFSSPVATASGVGIVGTDLVIQCLASDTPGTPVENPRQASSWRYSARYGPMPPCFSRATIATLGRRTVLLIGGTASIVGEQSQHQSDAEAQLRETLRNLGSLVGAARKQSEDEPRALGRLVDLRVYVTDDEVARFLRRQLARHCPNAKRVEIVRARLCRPELLVEIEGVADI